MPINSDESLIPSTYRGAESEASANAIYYVPINPFIYKQPAVPNHSFEKERLALLNDLRRTRIILLDLSAEMDLSYPATTPNMLARYLVVGGEDDLAVKVNAVVAIHYVMDGSGHSECNGARIDWKRGDVFLFPGGTEATHCAGLEGAVLYMVTDEPMLSFSGTAAGQGGDARVTPAYFPVEETDANLARTYARDPHGVEAAKSVWFVCRPMEALRTTSPNITANLNTLGAGDDQRAHRHNAAALTLSIAGEGVHSMVDGHRSDWSRFGVMVTPPGALHSHHNRGQETMRSFVVQDSGLHYYSRTTGFRFDS